MRSVLQGRLPRELAWQGIRETAAANEYLREYWPRHNAAFGVETEEAGDAFVPLFGGGFQRDSVPKETRAVHNDPDGLLEEARGPAREAA